MILDNPIALLLGGGAALQLAAVIIASGHALLRKDNSRAALGWVGFIVSVPILGVILYAVFGINRVRSRSQKLMKKVSAELEALTILFPPADDEDGGLAHAAEHLNHTELNLLRVGKSLTNVALTANNRVVPLHNGEQAYPVMLDEIRKARHLVWLTTYIFETNAKGREFIDALIAAKERGVDVRVILDGVGEWYSLPRAGRLLKKAGVSVARYLPPRIMPPQIYVNLRNHRKLLIVDGVEGAGFTGGMNIGGRHMVEDPDNRHPVQDLHFLFRGSIIRDFGLLFLEDWAYSNKHDRDESVAPPKGTSARVLKRASNRRRRKKGLQTNAVDDLWLASPTHLPNVVDDPQNVAKLAEYTSEEADALPIPRTLLEGLGEPDAFCRLISDGPDEDLSKFETLLASVLSGAHTRIVLFSPYFLPTPAIESALINAALRAVDVTVVIPEETNQPLVHFAMFRSVRWMLQHGVKVRMQPPPFAHTKVTIIDNAYVLVGSANMDPRSLRLNFELGVEVVDPALVTRLMHYYQPVIDESKPLDEAWLDRRALPRRVVDSIAWLFSPYL